jgi:amino-acid N-acetyltransferase
LAVGNHQRENQIIIQSGRLRPACSHIVEMVNRFAAENIMLPRTEESVRRLWATGWWRSIPTPTFTRRRSWPAARWCRSPTRWPRCVRWRAREPAGQGAGRPHRAASGADGAQRGYQQICALTLRENFFVRLGFELVDRWSISPKVWQACIYCPKFHRCDEVAVMMNLVEDAASRNRCSIRWRSPAGWNNLLKWSEWQPLKLAYYGAQAGWSLVRAVGRGWKPMRATEIGEHINN